MSWEDSPPTYYRCPCGLGTYSIIHRGDDWGRFDERWEMQCSTCAAEYGIYVTSSNRKGMWVTHHAWVPRKALAEVEQEKKRNEACKRAVADYMQSRTRHSWLTHFGGRKKAEIWSEITQDGAEYPALQTFYKHVRDSSLEQVLCHYLRFEDVATVLRILGPDPKLVELAEQVHLSESNLEEAHSRARAASAR